MKNIIMLICAILIQGCTIDATIVLKPTPEASDLIEKASAKLDKPLQLHMTHEDVHQYDLTSSGIAPTIGDRDAVVRWYDESRYSGAYWVEVMQPKMGHIQSPIDVSGSDRLVRRGGVDWLIDPITVGDMNEDGLTDVADRMAYDILRAGWRNNE